MQNQISRESRQVKRKGNGLNSVKRGSAGRNQPLGLPPLFQVPVIGGSRAWFHIPASKYPYHLPQVCSRTHSPLRPPGARSFPQNLTGWSPLLSRTCSGSPWLAGQASMRPGVQDLPLPLCGPLVPVTLNSPVSLTGSSLPQVHRPQPHLYLSNSLLLKSPLTSRLLREAFHDVLL